MRFFLLFCLWTLPVAAETFGNVEYHLPQVARDWTIGNQTSSERGNTVIYAPLHPTAREFFGVTLNFFSIELDDKCLKKTLSQTFPDYKIDLSLLDKGKDSILYEWGASQNGREKIHGWEGSFLPRPEPFSSATRQTIWPISAEPGPPGFPF